MTIGGLMKLTLLDFPGKVACTVFVSGCNFKCPFCHNASLVNAGAENIDENDFFAFLTRRRGILDGVCISGGEPTLYNDLPNFASRIKELGYAVKLDTNGSDPEMLERMISLKLVDYVAMDIKNSERGYVETCGGVDFIDRVEKSIDLLLCGNIDYEFRTTVVRELHSENDFEDIGKRISGAKRYYLQKFIDSGDILSCGMSAASDDDMVRFLETVRKYVPSALIRGSDA